MPIQISSMKDLVDMVNRNLGDFRSTFAYKRKELAGKMKASDIGILFKYEDASKRLDNGCRKEHMTCDVKISQRT